MKSSTPNSIVYDEFGRFPLETQVKLRMIKYWSKILSGKGTKFSYRMYFVLHCLHKNNIFSCKWISYVEKILQDVGLNYIWMNGYVTNVNWLGDEVQKKKKKKDCNYSLYQIGILIFKRVQNV